MIKMKVKRKKFHDPVKGVVDGTAFGLEETLNLLQATAKTYAPVDTGFLKASIFTRLRKFVGWVISPVSYSVYQEESANGGKGYMEPAAQYTRTKVSAIFGRSIRKSLRRS